MVFSGIWTRVIENNYWKWKRWLGPKLLNKSAIKVFLRWNFLNKTFIYTEVTLKTQNLQVLSTQLSFEYKITEQMCYQISFTMKFAEQNWLKLRYSSTLGQILDSKFCSRNLNFSEFIHLYKNPFQGHKNSSFWLKRPNHKNPPKYHSSEYAEHRIFAF
jgi:hypothetical protein